MEIFRFQPRLRLLHVFTSYSFDKSDRSQSIWKIDKHQRYRFLLTMFLLVIYLPGETQCLRCTAWKQEEIIFKSICIYLCNWCYLLFWMTANCFLLCTWSEINWNHWSVSKNSHLVNFPRFQCAVNFPL